MKDTFGRPIRVGDYLAYAMRKGNGSEMVVGVVLEDHPTKGLKVRSARTDWSCKLITLESWWKNGENMLPIQPDSMPSEVVRLLAEEAP